MKTSLPGRERDLAKGKERVHPQDALQQRGERKRTMVKEKEGDSSKGRERCTLGCVATKRNVCVCVCVCV
jgi:hypothetical protein